MWLNLGTVAAPSKSGYYIVQVWHKSHAGVSTVYGDCRTLEWQILDPASPNWPVMAGFLGLTADGVVFDGTSRRVLNWKWGPARGYRGIVEWLKVGASDLIAMKKAILLRNYAGDPDLTPIGTRDLVLPRVHGNVATYVLTATATPLLWRVSVRKIPGELGRGLPSEIFEKTCDVDRPAVATGLIYEAKRAIEEDIR